MKNCHVCEINPHPQEAIIQPTSSNIEPHPTPHICPFRSFTRGASPKSPKPGPWPAALRGSPEVSICVDVVTNTHLRPFRPFRRPIPANSCGPRWQIFGSKIDILRIKCSARPWLPASWVSSPGPWQLHGFSAQKPLHGDQLTRRALHLLKDLDSSSKKPGQL